MNAAAADPRTAIRKGSKSFYFASLFFSDQVKSDCWNLYRWCRYCDDRIDNGGTEDDLKDIKNKTLSALRGLSGPPQFRGVSEVCQRYSIPLEYPMELLSGFEKDSRGLTIKDENELEEYAYQVAGVVGLMMSYIMNADLSRAREAAKCMGNAMQLTNIARDIGEDFFRGRIYLPATWLKDEKIQTGKLMDLDQRESLFRVSERLLKKADGLYQKGYSGLIYLPLRSAIAVSIAASIYSSIGRKIRRQGPSALDSRIYVSFPEKLFLALEGIARVFLQIPQRLRLRRLTNE